MTALNGNAPTADAEIRAVIRREQSGGAGPISILEKLSELKHRRCAPAAAEPAAPPSRDRASPRPRR